jgi:hypothetical protein
MADLTVQPTDALQEVLVYELDQCSARTAQAQTGHVDN